MPLPALRPDGTLPPGIHIATLDDVLAAYPPITIRRQLLNQELAKIISYCATNPAVKELVIDGSYITAKTDPDDIDLALLFDATVGSLTVETLGVAGINVDTLVDAWVETEVWYRKWVTFFQTTIDDSQSGTPGYLKGVVRIVW